MQGIWAVRDTPLRRPCFFLSPHTSWLREGFGFASSHAFCHDPLPQLRPQTRKPSDEGLKPPKPRAKPTLVIASSILSINILQFIITVPLFLCVYRHVCMCMDTSEV